MLLNVACALLAAALAGAFTWIFMRGREANRTAELNAARADHHRITAELAAARNDLSQLSSLNAQLSSDLAAARAEFAARLAAEQQRLAERETLAARYLADAEKLKSTLQTEFQAIASKLLEEKSAKFTDHNKTQVEALLHPLRQQLADFRTRVDTVYKTESDDRSALKAQIDQLRLLNTRITDEAHALTTALKGQSQARGAWGELILDRLLESAGLIKGQDYLTQESLTTDDGRRLRPDVILRLPDARHLVIDSKVSLVAYERAVNAADDSARLAATREHAAAVRTHVEQLSAAASFSALRPPFSSPSKPSPPSGNRIARRKMSRPSRPAAASFTTNSPASSPTSKKSANTSGAFAKPTTVPWAN